MGQTFNPATLNQELSRQQFQWAQSLHTNINGDIDMGTIATEAPGAIDATGTPANFNKGNGSGVLIRVGASGSKNGPLYNWTTTGTGVVINHNLGRQPIGFHVVDSDKANFTAFRTQTATDVTISLAPSDATVNSTIYIF